MIKDTSGSKGYEPIPFRMHPRVFAALGADLVTNDVVAVIELVKNSYDAFANNVWITFGSDSVDGDFLEIKDDGFGMTREIIENVWCLVATPFKEDNPLAESGEKTRRVAGEKGLGRLSVARLGDRLQMLTQAPGATCWELKVDWAEISSSDDLAACYANCRKYSEHSPFVNSGTQLQIYGLKGQWDESRIFDLEQNLARLISPFSDLGEFNMSFGKPGDSGTEEVRIESPDFLAKPKYSIAGGFDSQGKLNCTYHFAPIQGDKARTRNLMLS